MMTMTERECVAVLSTAAAEQGAVRSMVWAMGARATVERLQCEDLQGLDLSAERGARLLEQAERIGIRLVMPEDAEWPVQLRELAVLDPAEAPVGLWVRGARNLAALTEAAVAVSGSRSATLYGEEVARDVAQVLAGAGVSVVNGAAFGCDQAALRSALVSGLDTAPVAVLACGADRAYPAAHARLLDSVVERGLVVSEVAPGAAPTRTRFLQRQRLIAALTTGVVIAEAGIRSSSVALADWAARLHHPVMAAPGPITSATSSGTHALIRHGRAQLLGHAEDALTMLPERVSA